MSLFPISDEGTYEQIAAAYRAMATKAKYRPAAPSDGFGNITVAESELDMDTEAREYALGWWEQEDHHKFVIGTCDFRTRPATIFAIEAARTMCAGVRGNQTALRLLKLAVKELEAAVKKLEAIGEGVHEG